MNNNKIVDKSGNAIDFGSLQPQSRAKIAENICAYMMQEDTREEFINSAAQYMYQKGKIGEDSQISLSIADEDFQDFCVLYGTQKIMDEALDENLSEAFELLAQYTGHIKFKTSAGRALTEDDLDALEKYYAAAPELQLAKQICDINLEVSATMHGQSEKMLTSFQANRIQDKFEQIAPYITYEQRAAGFYNVSMIHRALLAEKDYYNPEENNAEKECLKKVLEYSSDYKRIHYCVNRLGSQHANAGLIRSAYRRALQSAETDNDFYKINLALAQCYIDDYRPKMGFKYQDEPDAEEQKLERAEMYLSNALEYAQEQEKLNILKNIAKLQQKQGKIDEWTATKTEIAMNHMQSEERCHALMEIAMKRPNLKAEYLDRVIYEAKRDKDMDKRKKAIIINKAATCLRSVYEKQNNQEGLAFLDMINAKFGHQASSPANPLAQFKKRNSR